MPRLTLALIKKKSEHNEGVVGDLEEISLHQLQIEKIEAINTCKKLKILYLQNNIINKIEGVNHLRDLEYLNLAVNNIRRIEGLRQCEFLNKLDLTVNFIPLKWLESSIDELAYNQHLAQLFLVGNPCADWGGCQDYVIARVRTLKRLDGKEVTKGVRLKAIQRLPQLKKELAQLAADELRKEAEAEAHKAKKKAKAEAEMEDTDLPEIEDIETLEELEADGEEEEELEEYTPELRTRMYREVDKEQEEKEKQKDHLKVPQRRYDEEHRKKVAETRAAEAEGKLNQCNQGGFQFFFDEDRDNLMVKVELPKNLSSDLIDVDVQPTYLSIVCKTKVLRLKFDEEVSPDSGKCQRSQATGVLSLTLPKVVKGREVSGYKYDPELRSQRNKLKETQSDRTRKLTRKQKKGDLIYADAAAAAAAKPRAVNIRGIVSSGDEPLLVARTTTAADDDDDDEPPPLD